ncbi:MAG: cation transporter [Bacteroidales bacterium]|nr:cation transporter [Bacteroidales bacterium]
MSNYHQHNEGTKIGTAFRTGIILNIIFIVLEIVYGIISNSMALVSDAGHNFSDVLALVFSWVAIRLSQKKPTLKFTYGFRRSTILTAILNTILLIAASGIILWEAIKRISHPQTVDSGTVILVASAGILVNGITAWLFQKERKGDMNIRSAFLHFVADTLVSAGVAVSGIIIMLTGINWIDSAVSLIIIAVILYSSYRLLIDSVSLALDAVPDNIDIEAVRNYLTGLDGIVGIHDLHIWALSTRETALTVHLVTKQVTDNALISGIQSELKNRFNIQHSTIQIEFGNQPELCNDCN